MSSGAKIGLLAGAVALVVAAFVILQPGDDGGSPSTATETSAQATVTQATTTTPKKPRPKVATIRVKGGQPVGGVRKLTFTEGERIRFRVSADEPELVHLHGYDVEQSVGPGRPTSFDVPATIPGRFEAELENSAVQVAEVTVEP